jgi:hypothetical protein
MNDAAPINDVATGAEKDASSEVLFYVAALAFCTFFVFLAVAGAVWIMDDLSATLLPMHHVQ